MAGLERCPIKNDAIYLQFPSKIVFHRVSNKLWVFMPFRLKGEFIYRLDDNLFFEPRVKYTCIKLNICVKVKVLSFIVRSRAPEASFSLANIR